MAYRKLGRDNKHRRSMLATLTKQVVMNETITTTETRAKEVRKFVDKMITYGKDGSLVSRRKAIAFLHNNDVVVKKVFEAEPPIQEDLRSDVLLAFEDKKIEQSCRETLFAIYSKKSYSI